MSRKLHRNPYKQSKLKLKKKAEKRSCRVLPNFFLKYFVHFFCPSRNPPCFFPFLSRAIDFHCFVQKKEKMNSIFAFSFFLPHKKNIMVSSESYVVVSKSGIIYTVTVSCTLIPSPHNPPLSTLLPQPPTFDNLLQIFVEKKSYISLSDLPCVSFIIFFSQIEIIVSFSCFFFCTSHAICFQCSPLFLSLKNGEKKINIKTFHIPMVIHLVLYETM